MLTKFTIKEIIKILRDLVLWALNNLRYRLFPK